MQRVAVLRRCQRHAVVDATQWTFEVVGHLELLVAAVPAVLEGEVTWINPYRESGDNLNPGMGVRFSWSGNFSVAAQVDAYAYEDTSLGTAYDVGVTSTMFSFQYIF